MTKLLKKKMQKNLPSFFASFCTPQNVQKNDFVLQQKRLHSDCCSQARNRLFRRSQNLSAGLYPSNFAHSHFQRSPCRCCVERLSDHYPIITQPLPDHYRTIIELLSDKFPANNSKPVRNFAFFKKKQYLCTQIRFIR